LPNSFDKKIELAPHQKQKKSPTALLKENRQPALNLWIRWAWDILTLKPALNFLPLRRCISYPEGPLKHTSNFPWVSALGFPCNNLDEPKPLDLLQEILTATSWGLEVPSENNGKYRDCSRHEEKVHERTADRLLTPVIGRRRQGMESMAVRIAFQVLIEELMTSGVKLTTCKDTLRAGRAKFSKRRQTRKWIRFPIVKVRGNNLKTPDAVKFPSNVPTKP